MLSLASMRWQSIAIPSVSLLLGCQAAVQSPPVDPGHGEPPEIRLPEPLAAERERYLADFALASGRAAGFFEAAGFEIPADSAIATIVVFTDGLEARESLAARFGVSADSIPATFAGTVDARTLYLVSREAYRKTWERLYPDWPWDDSKYVALITHEVAHKMHESIAITTFGSADAMGPTWFFEGLATVCAGLFEDAGPPLTTGEIDKLLRGGNSLSAPYPVYARIVRSLTERFGIRDLVNGAAAPDFPRNLE